MNSHKSVRRRSVFANVTAIIAVMGLVACAKSGTSGASSPAGSGPGHVLHAHPMPPGHQPVTEAPPPAAEPPNPLEPSGPPISDNEPPASPPAKYYPLTWETSDPENRKQWSNYVFSLVEEEFAAFNQVTDATQFCARYNSLDHSQRVNFWGMLISEVSRHESDWKPTDRMLETGMGVDPVTHQHVWSEGLLQLSYQDTLWNPGCDFDWNKDKHLSGSDPRKTILDPYINLKCGIHIMAKQIANHKAIAISSGVYWSTLRKGSATQRKIATAVQNYLPTCHKADEEID